MGEFRERMDELSERVGTGTLTGSVVVDQVYARYQHEDLTLSHPNGGGAKYLYNPLMSNHRTYLQWVAEGVFEGPIDPMMKCMDYLSAEVFLHAPVELGDLRRSGSPRVEDNGSTVRLKPPIQKRLTEAELTAKDKLRRALGLGLRNGGRG